MSDGESATDHSSVISILDGDDEHLRIGATWGNKYLLRRVLGRGGSATVFAAEHLFLKCAVALKVPHVGGRSPAGFARLRREMEALARSRHPAVVGIIDGGEMDGIPYIAMQLLEGRTLSGLIAARSRLQAAEVAKLGLELAGALAIVHAAGVIHRDVKPSNVLVTADLVHQMRLLDFGTAKLVGTGDRPEEKLTQNGGILGTPEYMAPESLINAATADERADIYSLGVTLYECLSGAVPAEGLVGPILRRLSSSEAPRLTDVCPGVPEALAQAIHRSIRREPSERYSTMTEFARALSTCTSGGAASVDVLQGHRTRAAADAMDARPTLADPDAARRGYERAPYITLARIINEKSAVWDGRMEDISEGGALFFLNEASLTGDTVRLRFALPISGRILDVQGRSRWTRSSRGTRAVGFEFVDLPDAARVEIRQYVSLMGKTETVRQAVVRTA